MPTLLAEDGYAFRSFSSDGGEPPHVHVRGNGGIAKIWLVPTVRIADHRGYDPHDATRSRGRRSGTLTSGSRSGTGTSNGKAALAVDLRCDDREIIVTLDDGRTIRAPLTDRLRAATPQQRAEGVVTDLGTALHWKTIDEDIGVARLLGVSEEELYAIAGFEREG